MSRFVAFEFTEADAAGEKRRRLLQRFQIREASDPFALSDTEFVHRYRLTKCMVRDLCDELRPLMRNPTKSTDLSVETKVLVALSFYATGSYQRVTGDIGSHSVSQPAVCGIIRQITELLNLPEILSKYISFPRSSQERRANVVRFYSKFGMPGVLGCIDCTHVAIARPSVHEEWYYCRKQYHSLNVQLVSNADLEIISVDASNGGASHDSFVWGKHPLKQHMEELPESFCLLGDSGYPLRRYLLTPIINTTPGTPEAHYTKIHTKTRNVVERAIGLLKARFRCLLVHRVLHYSPSSAGRIVNACVVLHNMCVKANLTVPELSDEESTQEDSMQPASTYVVEANNDRGLIDGLAARRALMARLWSARTEN